jgi:hypothetical protein
MDKLEIKRALLLDKPSILYRTVGPVVCLGISGQLLLTHKPVGLLTCDILEVHGRFYWPGPSGLWLKAIGNGGKKRGHCHNNGFGNLLCIFYP